MIDMTCWMKIMIQNSIRLTILMILYIMQRLDSTTEIEVWYPRKISVTYTKKKPET